MINEQMDRCLLCPRECGINRNKTRGYCGETRDVRISRAALHMWEEPCISGKNGSGTVFFSGCSLKCVFCQNHEISHEGKGCIVSEQQLADIFLHLQKCGAHNINLVNPTHFVPQILTSLELAKKAGLTIPIVYNSGGYEKIETLEMLRGKVDIFLPDLKYYNTEISMKYSSASDYFERAFSAIEKMYDLVGKPVIEDGIMHSGVIVRHLVLPGCRHDSVELIHKLRERFCCGEIMFSLMSQYTPVYRASEFPQINRRISTFEYHTAVKAFEETGFDGWIQDRTSAAEELIPDFSNELKDILQSSL